MKSLGYVGKLETNNVLEKRIFGVLSLTSGNHCFKKRLKIGPIDWDLVETVAVLYCTVILDGNVNAFEGISNME